jgi:hypothetical protein
MQVVFSYVISVAAKISKYRGFCDKHHFTLMVVEVHNIFECDMDCFIRSVLVFFKIDNERSFILVFFYSIFQTMC